MRYSCADGTDHASDAEQASVIRRHIFRWICWRNRKAADQALNEIVTPRDRLWLRR